MGHHTSIMIRGLDLVCLLVAFGLISVSAFELEKEDFDRACHVEASSLTYDQVKRMIRRISRNATESGTPVSLCFRDRHDNLVAHIRMKNAILGSVDLSCQKARSSALFPAPSADFQAFPGIELSNGIISNLRGGLPIISATNGWVGSVGVSGASTGEQDEAFAAIAASMIDDVLKT